MAEPEKPSPRAPKRIGVPEFRGNFSGFMRQVRPGSSFVVTSRDKVVAIILGTTPIHPSGVAQGG